MLFFFCFCVLQFWISICFFYHFEWKNFDQYQITWCFANNNFRKQHAVRIFSFCRSADYETCWSRASFFEFWKLNEIISYRWYHRSIVSQHDRKFWIYWKASSHVLQIVYCRVARIVRMKFGCRLVIMIGYVFMGIDDGCDIFLAGWVSSYFVIRTNELTQTASESCISCSDSWTFCHILVWFGAAIYFNFGFKIKIPTFCTELDEGVMRVSVVFRDTCWLFVHRDKCFVICCARNSKVAGSCTSLAKPLIVDSCFALSIIHLFGFGKHIFGFLKFFFDQFLFLCIFKSIFIIVWFWFFLIVFGFSIILFFSKYIIIATTAKISKCEFKWPIFFTKDGFLIFSFHFFEMLG